MKRFLLVFLVSALALLAAGPALANVFFSEYCEGSSYNKAIEIYNNTNEPIDLAAGNYRIWIYYNGATTLGTYSVVPLSGTLNSGDVFVVVNTQCTNPTLLALADQLHGYLQFNGDDAVVLVRGAENVILDVIGQVGLDPGSQWGVDPVSTQDNTIRRKITVCNGDITTTNAFDPAIEWDGYVIDTFDGFGTHVTDCTVVPAVAETWGRVKTLYR